MTAITHLDVEDIAEAILAATAPLKARIAELEARQARSLSYQGVHQRASDYQRGDAVTHGGSLWIATRDAPAGDTPGNGGAWQLAVKAGK
jgi:hypothetical protein